MPIQQKSKNVFENNKVLNHILVHNLNNLHYNKISEGGFCEIFQSEVEFEYVYSSEGHETLISPSETGEGMSNIRKCVAVKKPTHS